MSKVKPILFSTEMVRAILEGRKTQTRRVFKNNPPYEVGDVLWVRETWAKIYDPIYKQKIGYIYKCGHNKNNDVYNFRWRPSIHMPKEACRLFLEVTSFSIERLQDISEGDAIREGLIPDKGGVPFTAKSKFFALWEKLYGQDSIELNPIVWVYEFKVIEKS